MMTSTYFHYKLDNRHLQTSPKLCLCMKEKMINLDLIYLFQCASLWKVFSKSPLIFSIIFSLLIWRCIKLLKLKVHRKWLITDGCTKTTRKFGEKLLSWRFPRWSFDEMYNAIKSFQAILNGRLQCQWNFKGPLKRGRMNVEKELRRKWLIRHWKSIETVYSFKDQWSQKFHKFPNHS